MKIKLFLKLYVLLLAITYCSIALAQPQKMDSISHRTIDRITIASESDYPPYCDIDNDGKPCGFSIDLFNATAKAMIMEVDIQMGIWNQIKQKLADGKIDALPLVGKTPDREELFDFTIPYLTLHGAIFIKRGTKNINRIEDLKNKKIAVMKGDNVEEYVQRKEIFNQITSTHTLEEAFIMLAKDEVDAVFAQRIMGLELLKKMNIKSVVPADILLPDFQQEFCFAVKRGDKELLSRLNEGLSVIIANKTYDKIHLKWFGPSIKENLSFNDVITIVIKTLVPFTILVSLIMIILLRRLVRIKTERLKVEIIDHEKTHSNLILQQNLLEEMEKVTKVGGWEYNLESNSFFWTNGVYDIYGVAHDDFDPSNSDLVLLFYNPDDRELLIQAFRKAAEQGESYDLELRITSSNGDAKWIRTVGQPEIINEKIVRLFGNILDITEQKKTETELIALKNNLEETVLERTKELNEKIQKLDKSQKAMLYMIEDLNQMSNDLREQRQNLEISNKELEAFSLTVSHDLRAPLRAIHGFSQILLEEYKDKFDDDGFKLLTIVNDNTVKMGHLIDDLLAFSRISRVEIKRTTIDMNSLIDSIYNEYTAPELKEKIAFTVSPLPIIIGDATLFKQVWVNLISNAVKFTGKTEHPTISISSDERFNEIEFTIKDNGAGFDMQYATKLFGVFERLHGITEFEGTGVGLAIVQRIITRHRGRIWASAEVNRGATFSFTVPKE